MDGGGRSFACCNTPEENMEPEATFAGIEAGLRAPLGKRASALVDSTLAELQEARHHRYFFQRTLRPLDASSSSSSREEGDIEDNVLAATAMIKYRVDSGAVRELLARRFRPSASDGAGPDEEALAQLEDGVLRMADAVFCALSDMRKEVMRRVRQVVLLQTRLIELRKAAPSDGADGHSSSVTEEERAREMDLHDQWTRMAASVRAYESLVLTRAEGYRRMMALVVDSSSMRSAVLRAAGLATAAQREGMWRRVFPEGSTPVGDAVVSVPLTGRDEDKEMNRAAPDSSSWTHPLVDVLWLAGVVNYLKGLPGLRELMDEETDDEDDGEEVNREKERERKRRRNEADDEEVRRKREEDSEKSTARVLFMLFAALNNEGMAMAMDTEEASDTEELSRVMYGLDAVAASVRSQCAHAAALARVPPRPLDGIIECVYHTAGSGAVWSRRKGVLQRERETEILAATHRVLGNVIGHVIDVLLARFHADPKMRERRSASRTAAAAARLVALRLYRQLDDATRAMCDRGAPHVLGEEPRLRPDLVDAKQRALWPSNARLLMPANVPVTDAHRDAAPLPRAEDYIASVGARVARRIAVMVCEFERVALFNLNARLPENRDRAAMYRTVTPRQWLLCSLLGRVDRSCAGFARLCIADAMDDALAAYYRDVVERLGEMDAETMARELDKAGRVRRDVEGASIYAPDVTVFGPFGFTERDEPRADPAYRELLRDGNYVRVLPQAERWADLPHLPLPDRRLLDRLVGSFMSTLFACHGMASVACAVLAAWKDYPETQEGRAHADRALRRAAEQGSGREPKEAGGPWGGMRSAHGPATLARAAGTSAGADVEAYVRQAVARQPFVERLARIGSALSNGTVAETAFTINDERDVEAVHDATVMCYRDPADIRRKLSAAGRSDPATFWRDVTETMRGFVMGYLLSCVVRVARDVVTVRWTRELSEVKSLAGIPWKLVRLDAAAGGTSVVAPRT